jgi:hypothetical protein
VALFESGIVQAQSSVGTLSVLVWQPSNTSTSTYGAAGSITAGSVLKDVTIINQGTATVYLSQGTTTASATPAGLQLAPGNQVTIQGYNITAGTATTGNIWGIAATGLSSSTLAGLASVASVV